MHLKSAVMPGIEYILYDMARIPVDQWHCQTCSNYLNQLVLLAYDHPSLCDIFSNQEEFFDQTKSSKTRSSNLSDLDHFLWNAVLAAEHKQTVTDPWTTRESLWTNRG